MAANTIKKLLVFIWGTPGRCTLECGMVSGNSLDAALRFKVASASRNAIRGHQWGPEARTAWLRLPGATVVLSLRDGHLGWADAGCNARGFPGFQISAGSFCLSRHQR